MAKVDGIDSDRRETNTRMSYFGNAAGITSESVRSEGFSSFKSKQGGRSFTFEANPPVGGCAFKGEPIFRRIPCARALIRKFLRARVAWLVVALFQRNWLSPDLSIGKTNYRETRR